LIYSQLGDHREQCRAIRGHGKDSFHFDRYAESTHPSFGWLSVGF
jgi:hypothetical protein